MKKFCPLALLALSLTACESLDTPLEYVESMPSASYKRTEAEAVKLARKAASSTDKHSRASQSYSISLITDQQSRSNELDTLCYIVNFDNEQGFALIAYDKRVTPVLAYSDQGNFTPDRGQNPAVYDCFIQKLPKFINNSIETASETGSVESSNDMLESCFYSPVPSDILGISWRQDNPYNADVIKRHPNVSHVVVGCVPLAACQAMVFGKQDLTYHSVLYDFVLIRESMQNYANNYDLIKKMQKDPDAYADYAEYLNSIVERYNTSTSYCAKILGDLGNDLHANYEPYKTSASTKNAMILLRSLGYNVYPDSGDTLATFNPGNAVYHILDKGLLQVRAHCDSLNGAHSWTMTTATYCRKNIKLPISTQLPIHKKFQYDTLIDNIFAMYVYCEWGWDGRDNGFYDANVFAIGNGKYDNVSFYSVHNDDILQY